LQSRGGEAYIESAVEVPSAEIELLGNRIQLSVIQGLAYIGSVGGFVA
jgi:hypothetical protein